MNETKLTILRGKLECVERGFAVDVYGAEEVRAEAKQFLADYPDMPAEERARCESLSLAGVPTRGNVQ